MRLGSLGTPATTAELLPVARAFRDACNHMIALCGARSTEGGAVHYSLPRSCT